MITLIHGEDTQASRTYYFELKKNAPDAKFLEGAVVTQIDLQQAVEGVDLFGSVPTVFIDELISKRKSPKEIEALADTLNKSTAAVYLWEAKELTPKQVGLFAKATVKLFKIPATIFALLDSIKPGNGKQLLNEFHQTLQDKDAEFVLVMLQRQIRILLAMQNDEASKISEVARMAPWQTGKLKKQAQLFSEEQLLDLHNKLFQLELNMKTGNLSLPLEGEIDLLLIAL